MLNVQIPGSTQSEGELVREHRATKWKSWRDVTRAAHSFSSAITLFGVIPDWICFSFVSPQYTIPSSSLGVTLSEPVRTAPFQPAVTPVLLLQAGRASVQRYQDSAEPQLLPEAWELGSMSQQAPFQAYGTVPNSQFCFTRKAKLGVGHSLGPVCLEDVSAGTGNVQYEKVHLIGEEGQACLVLQAQ